MTDKLQNEHNPYNPVIPLLRDIEIEIQAARMVVPDLKTYGIIQDLLISVSMKIEEVKLEINKRMTHELSKGRAE